MISISIVIIIEAILVAALCSGATYALHVSHISNEIIIAMNYFYPLSSFQVSVLIFSIVSMLGISIVFISGTRGLKWFIALLSILCLPSIASRSGIPEYLSEKYMIELTDINFLNSDISMSALLLLSMSLVAGFILLHQFVSLREMHQHFTTQGINDYDMLTIYKVRILMTVVILLVTIGIGYTVIRYSSNVKNALSESIDLAPLVSIAIVVLCASVSIAILCKILLRDNPKLEIDSGTIEKGLEKGFRSKLANEVKSVAAVAIPGSASDILARSVNRTIRIIVKPGCYISRMKVFGLFSNIRRIRFKFSKQLLRLS